MDFSAGKEAGAKLIGRSSPRPPSEARTLARLGLGAAAA